MGWVLLIVVVGIPLSLVGFGFLWDARQRRLTGRTPTIEGAHHSLGNVIADTSIVGMAIASKEHAADGAPNYGDLESDR